MKASMLTAACAAMLALTACATGARLGDAEKLALYRSHAGAPVDNFSYFGRINGWTPLGDSALELDGGELRRVADEHVLTRFQLD